MNTLYDFFEMSGILYYGCVPYDSRFVLREKYLADRYDGERNSLVAFAVPYYVNDGERNISVYAVPRDYHLYFDALFVRLSAFFDAHFPHAHFRAFADTSPFDERLLAAACGIGTAGDHGLIINEKYGSYVFLGSMVTDLALCAPSRPSLDHPRHCTHCGRCAAACPSPDACLSRITQTKGELSDAQKSLIAASGCAWGCDICQAVCPANRDVPETEIDFFRSDRTPYLSADAVRAMTDGQFAERAYAWKGRACILRNLEIVEGK